MRYTRNRTASTERPARELLGLLTCVAMALSPFTAGCGGEQNGTKAAALDAGWPIPPDTGSGPVDCTADDTYELRLIEPTDDFELGAATGWYASTEVCDACSLLLADLCEVILPTTFASDAGASSGAQKLPLDPAVFDAVGLACGGYTGSNQARLAGNPPPTSQFGGPYSTGVDRAKDELTALSSCLPACVSTLSPHTPNPPNSADPLPADLIPGGGRCGSQFAMHFVAGPFSDWGGTFGRSFGQTPLDATGWEGIAFWARVAPGSSQSLRVNLGDEYSDASYQQSLPASERHCNPYSGKLDSKTGCDQFGSIRTPGPTWQFYRLPFDEMVQGGWGVVQQKLDIANILSLQFAFKGAYWDLWIDDISLYRRRNAP